MAELAMQRQKQHSLYAQYLEHFCTKLCALLQIDVSFSCVCPVIDREFRHKIVKVAVDPGGDSRVDPQTTLTMV